MKAGKVNYRPEFPDFGTPLQDLAKHINVCDGALTSGMRNIFLRSQLLRAFSGRSSVFRRKKRNVDD
jgi:hypothetical protein